MTPNHAEPSSVPRFLNAGDGGLVVEFGNGISEAVNARVLALDAALVARPIAGIRETVPTYRSLLIQFDPLVLGRAALRDAVLAMLPEEALPARTRTLWRVPVVYGGDFGVDLEAVAAIHGLTTDEVIRLHTSAEYRVFMIGFAPGFAYLGGLPEALQTSRRREPRLRTPPASISIGGVQAAVAPPIPIPSGWHLLGRTPVRTYDPRRARPFLIAAGDRVRFHAVPPGEYEALCIRAEAGEDVAEREDGDD